MSGSGGGMLTQLSHGCKNIQTLHSSCPNLGLGVFWLLFGDDAQTSKRVGSNVKKIAWYSPMASCRHPALTHLPLFLNPTQDAARHVTERLANEVINWSFAALSADQHPTENHLGEPLKCARRNRTGKIP